MSLPVECHTAATAPLLAAIRYNRRNQFLRLDDNLASGPWMHQVFQFILSMKSCGALACVSRTWQSHTSDPESWTGSVVDLSKVYVPSHVVLELRRLFVRASAIILAFPNLHLMHGFAKPVTLRSSWQTLRSSWQQTGFSGAWTCVWLFAEIHCHVSISQWPVLPHVHLRLGMERDNELSQDSTAFSIGWCNTSCASQLARVALGENMRAYDHAIHVCMLHFPSVVSGSWHPQAPLTLQYFHGPMGNGFDKIRIVDMASPFLHTDNFHLHLQVDIQCDVIHVKVDNCETAVRVPSFFREARSPEFLTPCWAAPMPQWHFFCFH